LRDRSLPPPEGLGPASPCVRRGSLTTSWREVAAVVARNWRVALSIEGGLLLVCLAYCLVAPNQYEASAKVALRTAPTSMLSMEGSGAQVASILSAPLQQETLANFLRSDRLAWRVILDLKLYQDAGFQSDLARRFPEFRAETPTAEARAYLLERFQKRLLVEALPRSLVIQIRFRSRNGALSAAVVNDLIRQYGSQERERHAEGTEEQTRWLAAQLKELKTTVDRQQRELSDFQRDHRLLSTPELLADGQTGESQHNAVLLEIDELGRQLVTASTERILREAEDGAAQEGDPELVIASDPRLQAESGSLATALLQQIHARQSELELEQTRLAGVPARVYMLRGLKLETATGAKRVVLLFAERAAAWCAQSVLCKSPSMLAEALALRLAPAGKIRLIGDGSSNGVDVERFSPGPSTVRGALGIADDAEVVGFVGRLTRDKGVPELLEAFEKILFFRPRARLLLVGWFDMAEDALDAECKDRIANHPKIHCPGFVVDTAPYYRAMDVMVLRTWREGFPNVALEAEATEIPVITTESTEARDSIVPDVTGLLIPRGSPDAISDAVLKLLRDAGLRLHMGAAGRMWVSLNFADKRVLRLAVSYYRSLIGFGTAHGVGGDAQAGSPA